MKKSVTKILVLLTALSSLNIQTAFAGFSDVFPNHPNYEAIIYLQENGIINGYPDGTFKPDNAVNRAEFLKIVINGSDVPLDATQNTIFPDVDHSSWYGPYVKKAYAEDWINGYPDGTFKPEQTINKVEALKVLAKVQDWDTSSYLNSTPFNDTPSDAWYTPYVAYAKDHNFLEETGSLFFPAMLMTRAKISEIIYRSLTAEEVSEETEEQPEEQPEEEPQPEPEEEVVENFEPVTFQTTSASFYDNITLDESLPNIFYQNEVYIISGEIISGNYNSATVILDGTSNTSYTTFDGEVTNDNFSIPVHFSQPGNYNLGLVPGTSGQSKAVSISVLSSLPNSTNSNTATAATSTSISFEDDTTYVNFSTPESYLKKITFTQGTDKVRYYSRQDLNSVPIQYKDFEDFSEGTVSYIVETATLSSQMPLEISSDFVSTSSKNFQAVEHTFSAIDPESIDTDPPDTRSSASSFSFSGTVLVDSQKSAYIIKPDGFVTTKDLSTSGSTSTYLGKTIIDDGGNFTFSYTPPTTGRYIIEINDKNGEPILNHPIYIGSGIPLIPDFFDLNEREFFSGSFNLSDLREEWLDFVNDAREEHGLNTIIMADDLNDLAQAHSQDMAENNFFGHVNPDGETPEDRRIEAGISTAVSENLAKDVAIDFGHYGLMRSAAHRENILTPEWTRVGLGIALSDDDYLYLTQEFSTDEITTADLENYRDELYTEINNLRTDNSKTTLSINSSLESSSEYMNDKVINEDASLTNELFVEALDANNVSGSSEAIGRTYSVWSVILDSILTEEVETLLETQWERMGADIQIDDTGILHAILIINDNQ